MSTAITKLKRGWCGGLTTLTITSAFGVWRKLRQYGGRTRKHTGVDIKTSVGTTVYAPVSGAASCNFQSGGYGLYITLTSGGWTYVFAHLSSSNIARGATQYVQEGQAIGQTGGDPSNPNSGCSTGPHLHFEVRKSPGTNSSYATNPVPFMSEQLIGQVNQQTMGVEMTDVPVIGEVNSGRVNLVYIDPGQEARDNEMDASDLTDDTLTEREVIVERSLEEGLAAGIWQIVKLLIDGSVSDLRVWDVATSVQTGSLVTFFQKMCQMPLVEFMGDTYGDQFYFIARKPPFDREGMMRMLAVQGLAEKGGGDGYIARYEYGDRNLTYKSDNATSASPYEIDDNDIVSSNLSFNTQGIYSWYQFVPIYTLGSSDNIRYLVPAVMFPEYASIWGSRDLTIRSQYRNFSARTMNDEINRDGRSEAADSEVRNSLKDLKYIVETNAYNPFIRQGTITITGNRRVRKGMFIRVNWSGMNASEIFYVRSVSNAYSVSGGGANRSTTLTVDHGMMESFIFGDQTYTTTDEEGRETSHPVTYFDIINFGDYDTYKDTMDMDTWRERISHWKVDREVFMFFLRKMQLISQTSATPSVSVTTKNS